MDIKIDDYFLRDWVEDDAHSLAKYANNIKILRNLRDLFPYPYRLKDAQNFISNVTQVDPKTVFAIATEHEAIGSIGLSMGSDVHRYTAELGYFLAEPYWGKGIMTGAVKAAVDYAINELKLNRVYAEPYQANKSSEKVLIKAGFTKEGIMRANVFKDGKILDQVLYGFINRPAL
ncbi:MAG: GNAT family N-acetyltransferase [Desulfobacula sp.]|nr:GNAT family N-acetyltransferase [Desulfobacula sp.]